MTPLADVIAGLADRLATIDGLNVTDHVPGQAVFPAAFVVPPTIQFDDLGDCTWRADFEIPVLVPSAVAENQRLLIPFIDPASDRSIFHAVNSDRTLGGLDVDARATSAPRRVTFDEMAAYRAWGHVVLVTVSVS